MSWLLALIIGIAMVVIAYYVTMPPPIRTLLQVVGWILIAVGVLLLLALLLHIPVATLTG